MRSHLIQKPDISARKRHRHRRWLEKFHPIYTQKMKQKRDELEEIRLRELLFLEGILFSPVFVVTLILHNTHDFLVTLGVFHILLIALPVIFRKFKRHDDIVFDITIEMRFLSNHREIAVVLLLVPSFAIFLGYLILKKLFLNEIINNMRLPDLSNVAYSTLLIVDFVILNPIIEEVFWRQFCHIYINEEKKRGKLFVAFHFALYHYFVIYYISQSFGISAICFMALIILGHMFILVKKRFGLICGIIMHFGVDAIVALVLWDMVNNFRFMKISFQLQSLVRYKKFHVN